MKTLHTFEDAPKCYACREKAVGARTMHPVGEAHQLEGYNLRVIFPKRNGTMLPACARHSDTAVKLVAICTYCTGPASRGVVVDGLVAHAKCELEARQ